MSTNLISVESVGPICNHSQIKLIKYCGPDSMEGYIGSRECLQITIQDQITGDCTHVALNNLQAHHLGQVLIGNFPITS